MTRSRGFAHKSSYSLRSLHAWCDIPPISQSTRCLLFFLFFWCIPYLIIMLHIWIVSTSWLTHWSRFWSLNILLFLFIRNFNLFMDFFYFLMCLVPFILNSWFMHNISVFSFITQFRCLVWVRKSVHSVWWQLSIINSSHLVIRFFI